MSKSKSKMNALMAGLPNGEVSQQLKSMRLETDRGAALVGPALIDATLEVLLKGQLKHRDAERLNNLFSNRGPLSDLSSKIAIAVAFGFVVKDMEIDLSIVRKVRNVFAHSAKAVSFETAEIKEEIDRSILLQEIAQFEVKDFNLSTMNTRTKWDFLNSLLLIFLNHRQQTYGGDPIT